MFGKFEDAKNAKYSDKDERTAAPGALAVSFRLLNAENDEVRNDCKQIDNVHNALDELQLGRTRRQP